jgi:D-glycero-D-manno-heptose 1,7-bisphosphate phosphatase
MNKAIFLDRDGTINVEKHYLYKIEDFEFLPGVIEALRKLQDAGFLLIIITNQSGIGRGYYTEKDFEKLNNWMISYLKDQGIAISSVYYCPHLPDAKILKYRKECNCRKPKLGMYQRAINDYNIDLGLSYAIGDKIRDCAISKSTACKGFLIGNNEKDEIMNQVKDGKMQNISYAKDILSCANVILSECE